MIKFVGHVLLSLALTVGLLAPMRAVADTGSQPVGEREAGIANGADPGAGNRVNILLLGLDADVDRVSPARTDTIMLVSIDLRAQRLVLISIPRDLWVDIPGFGEGRINTAYYLGESYLAQGQGPALAKETVAAALDVPVDYYAVVNLGIRDRHRCPWRVGDRGLARYQAI